MHTEKEKSGKKIYMKPRLRMIELAAEEVLSVGCKTSFSDPKGVAGNGCLTGICSNLPGS